MVYAFLALAFLCVFFVVPVPLFVFPTPLSLLDPLFSVFSRLISYFIFFVCCSPLVLCSLLSLSQCVSLSWRPSQPALKENLPMRTLSLSLLSFLLSHLSYSLCYPHLCGLRFSFLP